MTQSLLLSSQRHVCAHSVLNRIETSSHDHSTPYYQHSGGGFEYRFQSHTPYMIVENRSPRRHAHGSRRDYLCVFCVCLYSVVTAPQATRAPIAGWMISPWRAQSIKMPNDSHYIQCACMWGRGKTNDAWCRRSVVQICPSGNRCNHRISSATAGEYCPIWCPSKRAHLSMALNQRHVTDLSDCLARKCGSKHQNAPSPTNHPAWYTEFFEPSWTAATSSAHPLPTRSMSSFAAEEAFDASAI